MMTSEEIETMTRLTEQRVGALEKCNGDMIKKLDDILRNQFTMMFVVCLLAFFAGINVWSEFMKVIIH